MPEQIVFGATLINAVGAGETFTNILPENANRNPYEQLFKDMAVTPGTTITGLLNDINLLKAIESENIKVQYFDFDGMKHEAYRSYVYRKQLEEELENFTKQTKANDKWVYDFCCSRNHALSKELKDRYLSISLLQKTYEEFEKNTGRAIEVMDSIYANMQLDNVNSRVNYFRSEVMPEVKGFLKELRHAGNLLNRYPQDSFSTKLDAFLKEEYTYFDGATLFNDQFSHVSVVCQSTLQYINHCIITETGNVLRVQETS
ncbi:MAG: hypothetical protein V4615_12415 [Bacteroidota bacterium]